MQINFVFENVDEKMNNGIKKHVLYFKFSTFYLNFLAIKLVIFLHLTCKKFKYFSLPEYSTIIIFNLIVMIWFIYMTDLIKILIY